MLKHIGKKIGKKIGKIETVNRPKT